MVWPTRNLIQSTPIVGSPPRTHTNTRSVRAKYLWPNMFLPTKMFSIPVYHIPESALRMENWKEADFLMDLKCAGPYLFWSMALRLFPGIILAIYPTIKHTSTKSSTICILANFWIQIISIPQCTFHISLFDHYVITFPELFGLCNTQHKKRKDEGINTLA